ncbi:MAG: hypothetical protein MJ177_11185, partial [Clostridia bacterium]|nr:hypothetical protein [Clostridia bacterium]
IFSRNVIVKFHYTTAELFANAGIKLVLTGHEHCGDTAVYTSTLGNVIYDFATTSLTMYPLQYRVFECSDAAVKYDIKTVDSIDTAALKQSNPDYTNAQLALMNKGLNDYSKQLLEAGVQYRLELSLTMEKMGISEEDFYYDLVNTAVGELVRDLRMPLYGKNSLSQKAAEYNMVFPETEYKNGWDLATELVAAHYAGCEDYKLDSPEVTILLRAVSLILRDGLANVNDKVLIKSANALFAKFGTDSITADMSKLAASVFGSVHPWEYFAVALISPLLYKFAVDCDGADDCTGSFRGYGSVDGISRAQALEIKYKNLFEKFFEYLNMYFSYIIKIFVK